MGIALIGRECSAPKRLRIEMTLPAAVFAGHWWPRSRQHRKCPRFQVYRGCPGPSPCTDSYQ